MKRLRLLAGFLGCLAVLAAGLPAIALASMPASNAAPAQTATQTATSEPCSHCPDCDGSPCQPAAAGCVLACVAAPPTLGVASFVLPQIDIGVTVWPRRLTVLSGLTPRPDPFPPRA